MEKLLNYKQALFALLSAVSGPFSLKYYLNYKSSGNSSTEFLLLYSMLWWIYFIIYVFAHEFTLHYIEVILYWTAFWAILILISSFFNRIPVIQYFQKSIHISERIKKALASASNNFFTFWFPVGCLVYFGYGVAENFDSTLIYYIFLWWFLWFVIWFIKQSLMVPFGKAICDNSILLYSKRKESLINYLVFILTYGFTYSIIFIMSFMKLFSLLMIVGLYMNKGHYLK